MKVFGVNEFGARAASAFAGLVTIALVYVLGKQIASNAVGLISSLALLSSPWFTARSRSGNLDIFLTLFFVLSFVLAFKARKNKKYFYPLGITLGLLFLTKTLVPFTIAPALLFLFINYSTYQPALIISLLFFTTWFLTQAFTYPQFILHFLQIGFPTGKIKTSFMFNLLQTKSYLHYCIGLIFRPLILLFPVSFLTKDFQIFSLIIFTGTFLLPSVLSPKTQIWHLIPVLPFLIIVAISALHKHRRLFATISTVIISISITQIFKNWHEIINVPAYISDEAILSKEAGKYPQTLYIDDQFIPAAVFYSGKNVTNLQYPQVYQYWKFSQPVLLITYQWRLEKENISSSKYTLLKSDRDKVLVLTNP